MNVWVSTRKYCPYWRRFNHARHTDIILNVRIFANILLRSCISDFCFPPNNVIRYYRQLWASPQTPTLLSPPTVATFLKCISSAKRVLLLSKKNKSKSQQQMFCICISCAFAPISTLNSAVVLVGAKKYFLPQGQGTLATPLFVCQSLTKLCQNLISIDKVWGMLLGTFPSE